MSNKRSISLFTLLCTFCLASCGEYEALDIEKRAKRSADSLYRTKTDSLKTLTDSLCLENYDKYYKMAYDSLKEEQTLKAIQLRDR